MAQAARQGFARAQQQLGKVRLALGRHALDQATDRECGHCAAGGVKHGGTDGADSAGDIAPGNGVAAAAGLGEVRGQLLRVRQAQGRALLQTRSQHAREELLFPEGQQGPWPRSQVQRLRATDVQHRDARALTSVHPLQAHGPFAVRHHQIDAVTCLRSEGAHDRDRFSPYVEIVDGDAADLEGLQAQAERPGTGPLHPSGVVQRAQQAVGGGLRVAGRLDELRQRQLGALRSEALQQVQATQQRSHEVARRPDLLRLRSQPHASHQLVLPRSYEARRTATARDKPGR